MCDGRKSRGGLLTENDCHKADVTDPPWAINGGNEDRFWDPSCWRGSGCRFLGFFCFVCLVR